MTTPIAVTKAYLASGIVTSYPRTQVGECLLMALSGHQSQRRYMSALGGKADIPIMAQLVPL
jgi:hypothetical protein